MVRNKRFLESGKQLVIYIQIYILGQKMRMLSISRSVRLERIDFKIDIFTFSTLHYVLSSTLLSG